MNFLAHFHLAWPDEGLVLGGLEGDYYKGPLKNDLPADIARGVALHRAIDAFTDDHPAVRGLRSRLPQGLRRYAGILFDLGFDHCLALNWSRYSDLPLDRFIDETHAVLLARRGQLSDPAQHMLDRLVEHNILGLYTEWQTVTRSAERIGERFRRGNPFGQVDDQLTPLRDELEATFHDFYPELRRFSRERMEALRVSAAVAGAAKTH